jgi:hypothetical protein
MDNENLRYDIWIEEALRQVIERALTVANEQGLPGDHHFYITFKTRGDGVEVPSYLRAEHPDEMTIVLQHQFDNLIVESDSFSVALRFNGTLEQLFVPYAAVTSFADPSVNFGLQLKAVPVESAEINGVSDGKIEALGEVKQNLLSEEEFDDEALTDKPKTGEIIALDTFRKKRS